MSTYIDTAAYRRLVAKLAALETDPVAGIDPEQVKQVLGEAGDIWPVSIRADVEAHS